MRTLHLAIVASVALAAPRLVAQNVSPMRDTTAYTAVATALRAQPLPTAAVLSNLPAGWPVHVSSCLVGWCSAQAGSLAGYLPADSLVLERPAGVGAPTAQGKAPVPGTSIGVDLSSRLTLGLTAGPGFRVVPEVSYVSNGAKEYETSSQVGNYNIDALNTELWVGLGLFVVRPLPVRPLGVPCLLYFGPRVGLAFETAETKVVTTTVVSDATAHRSDFWAGLALGGELLLSPHFSVGAEAQATKVFPGSPDVTGVTVSSPGAEIGYEEFDTRGLLVLRIYP